VSQKPGRQKRCDLTAEDWRVVGERFKDIFRRYNRVDFPTDPFDQLRFATEAVFKSWNGKRAIDYRTPPKFPMIWAPRSISKRWFSAIW